MHRLVSPQHLLLQNSHLSISPGLQASKPPSLQAFNLPRRVTRSANNPPAHPEDERRRAGSLPIPYPFPIHILPKPFLTGLRVTLRGLPACCSFFRFFLFLFKFSSQIPTFFLTFSRFRVAPGSIFGHFSSQNGSPEATFSVFFSKTVILSKSCSRCGGSTILKG